MARRRFASVLALALLAPLPAHAADFKWRGLLDLMLAEHSPAFDYNKLTRGDNPFDPYRLRLFADVQVNDKVQVLGQFVYDDASGIYVDGAYAIYTPWLERDLRITAGKQPWIVGTWAPRTYSNKNPLVTAPLMYQYHTSLVWYALPSDADALLGTAGGGQLGANYFGFTMGIGMPVIDDSYWDVGITLTGSQRPLEYAVGGMAGAPSWGSTHKDDNTGTSVLGRIGFTPTPAVRMGVSASYGPYLHEDLNPSLPAGKTVNDYAQRLFMADLEVQMAHVELHAEAMRNTWMTPTVGDLDVDGGYAELKYAMSSGLYVAGRYDLERFGKIEDSAGVEHTWDWNVTRIEGGVGYRIARDMTAKVVYQFTQQDNDTPGTDDPDFSIVGAQLSIGF